MITNAYDKCTACIYAPDPDGAWPPTIVAYINPVTDRTMEAEETLEEVQNRHPRAIRITITEARERIRAWQAPKVSRQVTDNE
jgi:hypothetical protein